MNDAVELLTLQATDPTLLTVREFRHGLRDALRAAGLPERASNDLMLAFQEHATNTLAHGSPPPKNLTLRLTREGAHWTLTIEDDGGPFDNFDGYTALATWADKRTDLRPNGLGLRLIGTRFPDHRYWPGMPAAGEANVLSLTLPPRASEILKPFVVIVEDDPTQRMVLKYLLSDAFRVADFERAGQALRVVRSHPADLILSDIEMPDMDGFAFRRELAKDHRTDTIPFVFLTGHSDDETADLASDLSIDDFLEKPVTQPILLRTARRLIRRARNLRERLVLDREKEATESLSVNVPKQIGGVQLAAASQSATAGGGDLVQTVSVKGRDVVLIADVMGHGLAARFFAHGVAAYFRSVALGANAPSSVDGLMTALSDALYNDPTYERTVVSAQMLAVDSDGVVEVASAGHPFPVHLSAEGPALVEIGGPLLGLADDLPFPSRQVTLAPGDRLLAYTDGLTEIGTERQDQTAAMQRLFAYTRDLADRTPADGLKQMMDRHREDAAGTSQDDVTALVLGR
ncbi:SpoIIE family protein phosphatase [Thalassobaculum sp.]|uniref:SpoIIE family protein phosphatase n=1 Tax=Thalassobaculum sp. TaxID=2022740 RepID=UPI0032EAB599